MTRPARMQITCTCRTCGATWKGLGCNDSSRCQSCKDKDIRSGTRYHASIVGRDSASLAVAAEVRAGRLKPVHQCLCVDCGAKATDYDHRDYNKPIDVEPVCRSCNLKRGPAKPLEGVIELCINSGRAPYKSKASTEKLFKTLGLDASVLAAYPARLTAIHWSEFWPSKTAA